jgi:hypothetical protein
MKCKNKFIKLKTDFVMHIYDSKKLITIESANQNSKILMLKRRRQYGHSFMYKYNYNAFYYY